MDATYPVDRLRPVEDPFVVGYDQPGVRPSSYFTKTESLLSAGDGGLER